MLEGVRGVDKQVVPFARLFYGQQSQHFWENDSGEVHIVLQGKGSEQGDAVMPLLFSLSSTPPSKMCPAVWSLANTSSLSCDIYVVSKLGEVGRIHDFPAAALWRHSGIQIHHGKTQEWNRARIRPDVCDSLERGSPRLY